MELVVGQLDTTLPCSSVVQKFASNSFSQLLLVRQKTLKPPSGTGPELEPEPDPLLLPDPELEPDPASPPPEAEPLPALLPDSELEPELDPALEPDAALEPEVDLELDLDPEPGPLPDPEPPLPPAPPPPLLHAPPEATTTARAARDTDVTHERRRMQSMAFPLGSESPPVPPPGEVSR
jgi:hypothetical protein